MGERRRDKKQLRATREQTRLLAAQGEAATTAAFFQAQAGAHQNAALQAQQTAQERQHSEQLRAMQQQAQASSLLTGRWGADPSGQWAKRWHDGRRWTEHVEDANGQRHSDPPPSSAG